MARIESQEGRTATFLRELFGARGSITPDVDATVSPTAVLFDVGPIQGRGQRMAGQGVAVANAANPDLVVQLVNVGTPAGSPRDLLVTDVWLSINPTVDFTAQLLVAPGPFPGTDQANSDQALLDTRTLDAPFDGPAGTVTALRAAAGTLPDVGTPVWRQEFPAGTPTSLHLPLRVFLAAGTALWAAADGISSTDQLTAAFQALQAQPGTNLVTP